MKTKITLALCLLFISLGFSGCKKTLENALSKDIDIRKRAVTFEIDPSAAPTTALRAGETEEILFDGILEVNVAEELQKHGFSFENIKSFVITNSTLELVTSADFNINTFKTVKLYFDNQTKLVARADVVDAAARKIKLTIVNSELLDKLKEDKLYIILTGQRPAVRVKLKLLMDFRARISLIK